MPSRLQPSVDTVQLRYRCDSTNAGNNCVSCHVRKIYTMLLECICHMIAILPYSDLGNSNSPSDACEYVAASLHNSCCTPAVGYGLSCIKVIFKKHLAR